MKQVTDPTLLEKLNAAPQPNVVTDPVLLAKLDASQAEKPGIMAQFFEGVGGSVEKRKMELSDTLTDYLDPATSYQAAQLEDKEFRPLAGLTEFGAQAVGKGVMGPVWDVAGETLIAGARGLGEGVGLVVGEETLDSVKQDIQDGINWISESPKAQVALEAIGNGMEAYQSWKAANPQDAKTLESVVNIGAAFVAPAKRPPIASPEVPKKTIAEVSAEALEKGALKIERRRARTAGEDLIDTSTDPKLAKSRLDRSRKDFWGNYKIDPSDSEAMMLDELAKLKIKRRTNTGDFYRGNYHVIQDAIDVEARRLEGLLDANKIEVSPANITQQIRIDAKGMVDDLPVAESRQALNRQIQALEDKALEIFSRNTPDTAGVLRSRKEFDEWTKSVKRASEVDNAWSVSVDSVRKSLNKLIMEKHGGGAQSFSSVLQKSLYTQHQLLKARDIIIPKADAEKLSRMARLAQNISRVTDVQMPTTPLAIGATVGSAGALLAGWAPLLALGVGVTGAGVVGKQVASSPLTYKALAETLRLTDKAIKKSTNPEMIKQLRLDRAALIEMSKQEKQEMNNKE